MARDEQVNARECQARIMASEDLINKYKYDIMGALKQQREIE